MEPYGRHYGAPARYHGSVSEAHGQIFAVYECACDLEACIWAAGRFELYQPDSGWQLLHVRRSSFTFLTDERDDQPDP